MLPPDEVDARALAELQFTVDDDRRLMALLGGYIDETGTHAGSPVTAVAGYVSTPDQWSRFQDDWRSLLVVKYGITLPFHMTDFEAGEKQYSTWKHDEARRNGVRSAIATTIGIRTMIRVGAAVDPTDYAAVYPEPECYSAYTYCALWCLRLVELWCDKYDPDAKIVYTFASGTGHGPELEEASRVIMRDAALRRRYRVKQSGFGRTSEDTRLQAADVFVWSLGRHLRGNKPAIGNKLFGPYPHTTRYFDRAELHRLRTKSEDEFPES